MIFWDYSYAVIKKNTIFAGKKVVRTPLKKVVLAFLCEKPFATFTEIAEHLSVNRSAVQKQIEGFRKKGYLDRRDNDSWHVLAMNSRIQKS